MTKVYLIDEERIEALFEKAKALNTRARRYKLAEAAFIVGPIACIETRTFTDWDGETRKYRVRMMPVRVAGGEPIKVAGWTFLARLEAIGGEHLIHVAPGVSIEIEQRFHKATNACEHCNTNRQRKDTYVLSHDESGRQMQIGSTCLRDFLGCDSPEGLAGRFEFFTAADELLDREARDESGWVMPEYLMVSALTCTATVIRIRGWASRAMVQQMRDRDPSESLPVPDTTSALVSLALGGSTSKEAVRLRDELKAAANDDDRTQAQAVIAYWQSLVAPQSDYERNLKILLSQDTAKAKHLGLVVSSIASWARATATHIGPPKADEGPGEWLGSVGERLRGVTATVVDTRSIETSYGHMTLVKMRDEAKHTLSWFASNARDFRLGATVKLTGTVKAHNEYKGKRETQLTRCKAEVAA